MDHERGPIVPDQGDDFERRAAAIRPKEEARVIVEFIDHHGVLNGVADIRVVNAVLPRRIVDVHTKVSYYETSLRATLAGSSTVCLGQVPLNGSGEFVRRSL